MSEPSPEVLSMAVASNRLGWHILSLLCAQEVPRAGVIISPYSIAIALAMLTADAPAHERTAVFEQIGIVDASGRSGAPEQARIHETCVFKDVLMEVGDATQFLRFKDKNVLYVAAEDGVRITRVYSALVSAFGGEHDINYPYLLYGAGPINELFSRQTYGLIPRILAYTDLTETHVVLVSATTLKAGWPYAFDPRNTRSERFSSPEGMSEVEMMISCNRMIGMALEPEYLAMRLDNICDFPASLSFIAYVPRRTFTVQHILPLMQARPPPSFGTYFVDELGIPKFNLRCSMDLQRILEHLGYPLPENVFQTVSRHNAVDQMVHAAVLTHDDTGMGCPHAPAPTDAPAPELPFELKFVLFHEGLSPNAPGTPLKISALLNKTFAFSLVAEDISLALFSGVFSVAPPPS
ncbi:Serpin domain-containing protein [Aspergillus aurantiobrunneus]